MQLHPLAKKAIYLVPVIFVLIMVLFNIQGKVSERSRLNDQARHQVVDAHGGAQLISPPMLLLEYEERQQKEVYNGKDKKTEILTTWVAKKNIVFANDINVNTRITTQTRTFGLYSMPVYHSAIDMKGDFKFPDLADSKNIKYKNVSVLMGVNILKSISNIPSIKLGDKEFEFSTADSQLKNSGSLLQVKLSDYKSLAGKDINFSTLLNVKGSEYFNFLPVAENTAYQISADWPHPSFKGISLPEQSEINDQGFVAQYKTHRIAAAKAIQCVSNEIFCADANLALGVQIFESVNIYTQLDRISKYAFMFILICFIALFIFEVMKRTSISNIQYVFVGAALMIFYLLLLALSEHISFFLAYVISSTACLSLIGIYLSAVLKSIKLGVGFTAALSALYAYFYFTLLSEDYALLMGSLLMFALLAVAMVSTRHVDWSTFGLNKLESPTDTPAST